MISAVYVDAFVTSVMIADRGLLIGLLDVSPGDLSIHKHELTSNSRAVPGKINPFVYKADLLNCPQSFIYFTQYHNDKAYIKTLVRGIAFF